MEYQIIVDSCVDFNEKVFGGPNEIKQIPSQLLIDDEMLTDEGLDSDGLIRKVKANKRKIITACLSLRDYLEAYKPCAVNYVAAISSRLSGSFQNTMAAKQILEESGNTSRVYVIDSESASAGQTLAVLQLKRMLEQWIENSRILLRLSHYITHLQTPLISVSLDNLKKNGQIKGIQVIVSKVLHIIPILGSNGDDVLELKEKARGERQAMEKLLNIVRRDAVSITESVLTIAHVGARVKAEELYERIKSLFSFREVIVFQASGLSTVYADDDGIVLSL